MMVARGGIGFPVSAIADPSGIFGDQSGGSIFIVVTWCDYAMHRPWATAGRHSRPEDKAVGAGGQSKSKVGL